MTARHKTAEAAPTPPDKGRAVGHGNPTCLKIRKREERSGMTARHKTAEAAATPPGRGKNGRAWEPDLLKN